MAEATEATKAAVSTETAEAAMAEAAQTAETAIAEAAQTAETTIAEATHTAETAIADAMPNAMSDSCHGHGFRVIPRVVGNVVAGAGHGDQTEQKKHSSDLHVGSEKKKSSMGVCLLLNS